jgi:hypothetical protein
MRDSDDAPLFSYRDLTRFGLEWAQKGFVFGMLLGVIVGAAGAWFLCRG